MSGLCGWIGRVGEGEAEPALRRMAAALLPGGDLRLALAASGAAAVRGARIDRDIAESDGLIAATSGYPRWTDASLAELAASAGHGAALLEGWRRHGRGVLAHLRGAFAIALLDPARNRALVAIDRYGIESLGYAHPAADLFVFGSSADSVQMHPRVASELSPQALYDYLHFFVVPAPQTVWRGQSKLLPGQMAEYAEGVLKVSFYWQMPYAPDRSASEERLAAELPGALRAAVARSLQGEPVERTGAFLSGGLDSSTVAGLFAEAAPGAASFTVGFSEAGYDESDYARIAARHFGLRDSYRVVEAGDVAAALPRLIAACDEPFGNSSLVAAYWAAATAREAGIETMLAGDGGDELFGGNSRYVEERFFEPYRRLPHALRTRIIEPLLFAAAGEAATGALGKARRYVERARHGLPDRLLQGRREIRSLFAPGFLAQVNPAHPLEVLAEPFWRTPSEDWLHRMMHLDMQLTLADNDLRKVKTACAVAGVRHRFPLLDDDLVEFAARVPPGSLVRGKELRSFYKAALAGVLPEPIIRKKKHGFGLPYDRWVAADPGLRALVMDHASAFAGRGLLQPGRADPARLDTDLLWDLAMLEMWLRSRGQHSRRGGN